MKKKRQFREDLASNTYGKRLARRAIVNARKWTIEPSIESPAPRDERTRSSQRPTLMLAVEPVEERTRRRSTMPQPTRSVLPTKSVNTSWAPPDDARGTMAPRIPGPANIPSFVIGVRSSPPSIPIASSPWAGWILLASALFLCATVLGAFLYYG